VAEIANKILDQFTLAGIPSLPELLLQELDMLQQFTGNAGGWGKARELADTDLFLNARLLGHAEAAALAGTGTIAGTDPENLAAIIRQSAASTCFANLPPSRLRFLKQLYLQSVLAQGIAISLADRLLPESGEKPALVRQAGFCGMLLNIGALVLEQVYQDRYLELVQQAGNAQDLLSTELKEFGIDHAELGASLMERWQVEGFCCDAVRYHHQAIEEILDATMLVRIAWLSNRLADEKENPELADQAQTLFALNSVTLASIRETATASLYDIAQTYNVAYSTTSYLPLPDDEDEQVLDLESRALASLKERVEADSLISAAAKALALAESPEAFASALGFAVRLLHSPCQALLFALDTNGNVLRCIAGSDPGLKGSQLNIRCEAQRSVIADSCLQGEALYRLPTAGLTVIDRQIRTLLAADNFCCEPLHHPVTGTVNGVLVVGVPGQQSEAYKRRVIMRRALARELGAILSQQSEGSARNNDIATDYDKRIRETIHEINNPLGIIKNYLQLLSMKQDENTRVRSEISFIKSEIDRVSQILEKLKQVPGQDKGRSKVDINAVVASLTALFSGAIGTDKKVQIETRLDKSLPAIPCSEDALRQIITNLVKNAAEALAEGGIITIKTAGNIFMNGEKYLQLSVRDDGPGIAPDILDNLFAPGHSTKGVGHTGSGLAIVRNLVKNLRGQISCQTFAQPKAGESRNNDSCGTEFTVLLPMTYPGETTGDYSE
jgi:signal transduction histidine kinase